MQWVRCYHLINFQTLMSYFKLMFEFESGQPRISYRLVFKFAVSIPSHQITISEMTLQELTKILKAQFDEISAALFKGSLNIEYLEETDRVFGEASTMFGANILRYSESN